MVRLRKRAADGREDIFVNIQSVGERPILAATGAARGPRNITGPRSPLMNPQAEAEENERKRKRSMDTYRLRKRMQLWQQPDPNETIRPDDNYDYDEVEEDQDENEDQEGEAEEEEKPLRDPFEIIDWTPASEEGEDDIMTSREKELWLESSRNWDLPAPIQGWKGIKFLGLGGSGIVGLWEYHIPETGEVKKVVVKQCRRATSWFKEESRLLSLCHAENTGSMHIVQQLRRFHRELGQGSHSFWDRSDKYISRIYLEYCENGDMKDFLDQIYSEYDPERRPLPEYWVWKWWECLARAVCVLDAGNENLEGDKNFDEPIGHFDIKPANILVGGRDADEHETTEIFKIADFGLALQVPSPQTEEFIDDLVGDRGTPGWKAPEQYPDCPNRTLGSCTNIWGIAKCIYALMTYEEFGTERHICQTDFVQGPFESYGGDLRKATANNYSNTLVGMVWWCLTVNPTKRPTPRRLLRLILLALENFKSPVASPEHDDGDDVPSPDDDENIPEGEPQEIHAPAPAIVRQMRVDYQQPTLTRPVRGLIHRVLHPEPDDGVDDGDEEVEG